MTRPNIVFVMTDQQRFDTIAALGNTGIFTPNLDRLVRRGTAFTNAYTTCPVCVPARYTIRSGREPSTTGMYTNRVEPAAHERLRQRSGPWLAEALRGAGYRTWGVGKFHTRPWGADEGFETQLRAEELYHNESQRSGDDYASWIAAEHPEYSWIEQLMGERTDMYNVPQMSHLPADLTMEAWTSRVAVDQISAVDDERPFFGFVSFIGPHPPLAPPLPFNRLYDPDRMPDPVCGELSQDHTDEQIPYMNHLVWSEDVATPLARQLKARYYGMISHIDACLGVILDAIEACDDADNTLIAFYSDHGEHLGDHHAWQKESFFEAATRVPFLVSWPGRIPAGERNADLVALTDLFGLATGAAGILDQRDGIDLLGTLDGRTTRRESLIGLWGEPGTPRFKMMVRRDDWKLIWMANGGRVQLFNVHDDPAELREAADSNPALLDELLELGRHHLRQSGVDDALTASGQLATFEYESRPRVRLHQFDESRGVDGFPATPEAGLAAFRATTPRTPRSGTSAAPTLPRMPPATT